MCVCVDSEDTHSLNLFPASKLLEIDFQILSIVIRLRVMAEKRFVVHTFDIHTRSHQQTTAKKTR